MRGTEWLALESQTLNPLAKRLGDVESVGNALSHIKVVSGNTLIDELVQALARLVFAKVRGRMFERILQLLSGKLECHQSVFVLVEAGDIADRDRALRDARLRIEAGSHRNVGFACFHLHPLNQINDRRVAKATILRRQLF